ncbi:MAG: ABC transporter permease [Verrucomicrobia subdivision 3 bacterium]|nr:ABC transporter permease [Limisphaerales bacterium]
MERLRERFEPLGAFVLWSKEVFVSIVAHRLNVRDLLYQMYFIGVKSQSVVFITGAFTGMVLAAQTYFQFHRVRMDHATLAVVSISMCAELGPVLAGLMVAGRVGAALAAELGTMRVTEQIDALRTLAAHPIDYLVVPRFLATVITMPLLTAASIAIGIAAGYGMCRIYLGTFASYAYDNMVKYTGAEDFLTGLIKALFYGGMIGIISCYKGMTCREGAEGVGRATTEAVVYSSITILISNFFLTLVLNKLLQPA